MQPPRQLGDMNETNSMVNTLRSHFKTVLETYNEAAISPRKGPGLSVSLTSSPLTDA